MDLLNNDKLNTDSLSEEISLKNPLLIEMQREYDINHDSDTSDTVDEMSEASEPLEQNDLDGEASDENENSLNTDIGEITLNTDVLLADLKMESPSLDDDTRTHESHTDKKITSSTPEGLYHDTIELLRNGEIDSESAFNLIMQAGQDGCALAWLFLGQIYSDTESSRHNYALAFECFGKAAKLGNGDGLYNLGLCYSRGLGCEADEESALECFSRGAADFHTNCICALGMCYEFGVGCDINYKYATVLYEKGAELGHAICANNLGGCYLYGHGVPQDKEKAIELFHTAASLGCSDANCRLGLCYEEGNGCEMDYTRAMKYYQMAAKEGNPQGLFHVGLCYDKGIGVEQNFNHAFKYYEKAARLGLDQAKYEVGKMYMTGRGTRKNPDLAYKNFASAARHGYKAAEYEVANCFFEGKGTMKNRGGAYVHYCRAYEEGENSADAAYRLGICNLKGLGVAEDKKEAFEWFSEGSRLGSADATYMLGECYYYGVGVAEDKESAVALYEKSIEQSDLGAHDAEKYTRALLALAICYEKGIGIHKNPTRAIQLYKQAAELGGDESAYRTGIAIVQGVGMKSEYAAARVHFLRAARQEYLPAMLHMGIFAQEGKGVQRNIEDAKSWFTRVVSAQKEPEMSLFDFPERFKESEKLYVEAKVRASYRLGMLLSKHYPSTQNYIQSYEYIAFAASMNFDNAKIEICKIYVSGGDLKNYFESGAFDGKYVFDNGASEPDERLLAEAINKLGNSFFDGKSVLKKNESSAAKCYKIAAELNNIDAIYSYGWCLRHGVGIAENDAEAVRWLKIAADRGHVSAAYSYALCCEEGAGMGVRNKREALFYYRNAAASGHVDAAKRYMILSSRDN